METLLIKSLGEAYIEKGCSGSQEEKMHGVMHKYKKRTLHSGSKKGPIVQERDQAVAIGLSESGQAKKSIDEIQAEVIEKARRMGAKDKQPRKKKRINTYTQEEAKKEIGSSLGMPKKRWEQLWNISRGRHQKYNLFISKNWGKSIDDIQEEVIEKSRTTGAKDKITRKRRALTVPEQHQLNIAKKTLKMTPVMANIMGGMSLDEAKKIVARYKSLTGYTLKG